MLVVEVKGVWRAREKRVTLQVYLPLCEPRRTINSIGNELAIGGPTMIPSPLTTLLPLESNQVKIGVLWIPSESDAVHEISYMFPATGLPMDKIDRDRAVAGTAVK